MAILAEDLLRFTAASPYRQWTLENFSGTLCIDEIHLGHRALLLATDPVNDFPVAFALVRANDQDHMRRFLHNLQNWGFAPSLSQVRIGQELCILDEGRTPTTRLMRSLVRIEQPIDRQDKLTQGPQVW